MVIKLKYPNEPASPKQKLFIARTIGIPACPPVISKKGGASIAIACLIFAKENNQDIVEVTLPAGCFCTKFMSDNSPRLETVCEARFKKGIRVYLLVGDGSSIAPETMVEVSEKAIEFISIDRDL